MAFDPAKRGLPRKARRPGLERGVRFVYFVQAKTLGFIKIGATIDLNDRLRQLTVNSPDEIELIGSILCEDEGRLEAKLHARFSEHIVRGEWFRPAPELLAYIAEKSPTPWQAEKDFQDRHVRPALAKAIKLQREEQAALPPPPKIGGRKAILAHYKAVRGIA